MEPTADVMKQALAFMKDAASKQEKLLTELAVQTSPSLLKLASISKKPSTAATQGLRSQAAVTQRMRAAPVVQPTQLFSALVARPGLGGKRPRPDESEDEDDDDDEEDEVSSRLARRVQRHRKMMAQSRALAPES
jgi:hypothetical protein